MIGAALSLVGVVLGIIAAGKWSLSGFGNLHPTVTIRLVICSVVFMLLGAQTALAGFFFGLMNLLAERRTQRAESSLGIDCLDIGRKVGCAAGLFPRCVSLRSAFQRESDFSHGGNGRSKQMGEPPPVEKQVHIGPVRSEHASVLVRGLARAVGAVSPWSRLRFCCGHRVFRTDRPALGRGCLLPARHVAGGRRGLQDPQRARLTRSVAVSATSASPCCRLSARLGQRGPRDRGAMAAAHLCCALRGLWPNHTGLGASVSTAGARAGSHDVVFAARLDYFLF